MVAKCNITGLVLGVLAELQWGFKCKDRSCAIIENYIEYLNCPDIHLKVCNPADSCDLSPVIFNCSFNILSISATLNPIGQEADVIFDLKVIDYAGGRTPFTYNWIYDEDDFDLIGTTNDEPQIKLKMKEDKLIELLVSEIQVEITDADGCRDTKSCWITPEGMQCNINFEPCLNPVDMQVEYIYIPCAKPKSLSIVVGVSGGDDDEDNMLINGTDTLLINGTDEFII